MNREYNPNYVHEPVFFEVGVKLIIKNEEGKMLILRRSQVCGDKYSLAGGGVYLGEDVFEACSRECEEELGVSCNPIKILFTLCDNPKEKELKRGIVIVVECQLTNKNINLNWEHDSYDWLDINSALSLELTTHAKRILLKLKED